MSYIVRMQKPASYQNKPYGGGTIGSSACGPAALVNCLVNSGIADISVPDMAKFAINCGARWSTGTSMPTLLKAAAAAFGFTYKETSLNNDLLNHLKKGYTAVLYNGNLYPHFTSGGHYTAAIGLTKQGYVVVADSLYYNGKWNYLVNGRKRSSYFTRCGSDGIVHAPIGVIGNSTKGKSPSYFLIYPKKPEPKKEVEDLNREETKTVARDTFAEIEKSRCDLQPSSWAIDAWNKAFAAGILDGTTPRAPMTREMFAVVLDKLGLLDGGE